MSHPRVTIRAYAPQNLPLLERLLGDPDMMCYLGGPESPDAIAARHERYLRDGEPQRLFAIELSDEGSAVGWVGYWETSWQQQEVWECGWHVLPAHQRAGVATAAVSLVCERARSEHRHRHMHAFPSIENVASNSLCRRLGFELLGETEVEYPKGRLMRSNDWRLDLGSV